MNRAPDTQSSALSPQSFFLLLLILLAGAAIQFHALVQDVRFYPDEALFSTFARNAALNGDWLLHGDLDKTPLSIYASALSMNFVAAQTRNGVLDFDPRLGEFAARLPGALASIVLIAVDLRAGAAALSAARGLGMGGDLRRLLALHAPSTARPPTPTR